ncbi:MAG: transposase domain-containing protein [Mesorhizobium sp.]|nr:MAG: transposase domain-containing protein [Mesorhizobium sp.]TKB97287.1 MAG: transposase domain-containing protein [Mesorhizobium sp.]
MTTAKMNQVDPHAWPTQALERTASGWLNSDIGAVTPWNYLR